MRQFFPVNQTGSQLIYIDNSLSRKTYVPKWMTEVDGVNLYIW